MHPEFDDQSQKIESFEDEESQQEDLRTFADFIARLLDTLIRVPGTSIRIGLDPLLGLLPGLGDLIANFLGSTILLLAIQLRVPKVVILRMAANIGINTLVGTIPAVGDIFSIWYKSNLKNALLLRRYTTRSTSRATIGDWIFVSLLILVIVILAISMLALVIYALQSTLNLFQQH